MYFPLFPEYSIIFLAIYSFILIITNIVAKKNNLHKILLVAGINIILYLTMLLNQHYEYIKEAGEYAALGLFFIVAAANDLYLNALKSEIIFGCVLFVLFLYPAAGICYKYKKDKDA